MPYVPNRGLHVSPPRPDTYYQAVAVTPSDTVDLTVPAQALWIGSGGASPTGDVKVNLLEGGANNPVIFKAVPTGTLITAGVSRVFATGTGATLIIALS